MQGILPCNMGFFKNVQQSLSRRHNSGKEEILKINKRKPGWAGRGKSKFLNERCKDTIYFMNGVIFAPIFFKKFYF